jgi:hypothetical protein
MRFVAGGWYGGESAARKVKEADARRTARPLVAVDR